MRLRHPGACVLCPLPAAAAALAAFHGPWSKTSFEERAVYLDRIAAAIEARAGELAAFESEGVLLLRWLVVAARPVCLYACAHRRREDLEDGHNH